MKNNPVAPDTPAYEATEWFSRQRSGEMTTAEARAFEVWLARDPEHQAVFRKVERTWALLGDLDEDPSVLSVHDRVARRLDGRSRVQIGGAIAAGLVLAAAGGVELVRSGALSEFGWFAAAPVQEFQTGVGQRRAITLADGSIVTLDTDTVLRAQLSGHQRRITLDRGQASFQVAKDKYRPFIVAAAGMTVRATGTEFDVRSESGRFEVTLIEGRVRVQEQGREREDAPMANMRPGWRLALGEDTRWRMEPVDIIKETSWHEGYLTFHDDPIERAAAEMNRYSQRKIVFKGAPPETVVMGKFRTGDVEGFVRGVKLNKLARVVSETDDTVELAAR